MIIRLANRTDKEWIIRHRLGLFHESGSSKEYLDETEILTRLFLDDDWTNHFNYYLAEDENTVVGGYAMSVLVIIPFAGQPKGRMAYLWNMYVEPEYRSRGIGRALLKHAISVCKTMQVGHISLHTTKMGRALYESEGFKTSNRLLQLVIPL
ncbi:MAG: GNAT family N-acetyltransferase [Candidatus Thorarchaeota archaeon]